MMGPVAGKEKWARAASVPTSNAASIELNHVFWKCIVWSVPITAQSFLVLILSAANACLPTNGPILS